MQRLHAEYEALKATEDRCAAEAHVLFSTLREVYTKATAEGHFIDSWHFSANATRDLILANRD